MSVNKIQIVARVIFILVAFYSSALLADKKPVAPEMIDGAKNLSAEAVIELILSRPDMVIIDSRKKVEYLKGHIEGAISMLNTEMETEELAKVIPDKKADILFYCNGIRCKRSSDAVSKALSWGYENVYWFRGGWKEWTEKRLPVEADE